MPVRKEIEVLRICIVTRKMVLGGVERTLLSFLSALKEARDDIHVDLCLQQEGGDLYEQIPNWVCIRRMYSVPISKAIRHPLQALRKLLICLRLRIAHKSYTVQCWFNSKIYSPLSEEYDIAISYHAPNTIPVFYVSDKVKARKKILWLHGTMEENGGKEQVLFRYHEKYDQVVCVSKTVYDSFVRLHPTMTKETLLHYNLIHAETIREMAQVGKKFPKEDLPILLTIGRLDRQKGLDIAAEACLRLVQGGYSFKWYVCGDGEERNYLEYYIQTNHLEEVFILLGNQRNPYGYLSTCDIYVQPSRCEGYCTATAEAKVLGKPVITTDVSGAREQFGENESGWIVPISADGLYKQISWCIDHHDKVEKMGQRQKWDELPGERLFDFLWENV